MSIRKCWLSYNSQRNITYGKFAFLQCRPIQVYTYAYFIMNDKVHMIDWLNPRKRRTVSEWCVFDEDTLACSRRELILITDAVMRAAGSRIHEIRRFDLRTRTECQSNIYYCLWKHINASCGSAKFWTRNAWDAAEDPKSRNENGSKIRRSAIFCGGVYRQWIGTGIPWLRRWTGTPS